MEAASAVASSALNGFRTGTKKIFLPSHSITFLAPRPNQPPTFATFKVPLTFNKFDLRDYLLHAYNTPVLAVRSQLRQRRALAKNANGRLIRPRPIKTMTVQLTQPFVWPRMPTDIKPWKAASQAKMKATEEYRRRAMADVQKTGKWPSRDERKEPESRKNLRQEAARLLKEGGWTNNRELDPRFSETKQAKKS